MNKETEKKLEAECKWINEVLWKIESNVTFPQMFDNGPERAAVLTYLLNKKN